MTITNDFLAFAQGGGANVETQTSYAADPDLPIGNQPGIASSAFNNKALRQANAIASQVAQFIGNQTQTNMTDDATPLKLLNQIAAALTFLPPTVSTFTSGSGNFNLAYWFFILSGSASATAIFSHNGNNYTVVSTVASGTLIQCTGAVAPLASGTLVYVSGPGSTTSLTFNAVRAPIELEVEMVGGGGGGGGGGSSAGNGGNGGNTTFGTALLAANGGDGGGGANASVGAGGTVSIGGEPGIAIQGGIGGGVGANAGSGANYIAGGAGAPSPFGGQGASVAGSAGSAAVTNSGSGGGGGGAANSASTAAGGGGGAGGYVKATITAILSTYAWVVGAAGTFGTSSAGGNVGGAGGSGMIKTTQRYQ